MHVAKAWNVPVSASVVALATTRNQDCGKVANSGFVGYTKPSQMPGSGGADVTVKLYEVGFAADDLVHVYDIWKQQEVGTVTGTYTAQNVPLHGTAFLRLSKITRALV